MHIMISQVSKTSYSVIHPAQGFDSGQLLSGSKQVLKIFIKGLN